MQSKRDFDLLVHRSSLRSFAVKLAGSHAEADDLVQDTFARALRGYERLRFNSNIGGWLRAILYRLFIDHKRKTAREVVVESAWFDALPTREVEAQPRWTTVPDEALPAALAQIPPIYRETYDLYIARGCSYAEIASLLNIAPGTVGTRIARARNHLQRLLLPAATAPR
jgi:RNA polymerase sigma-70 factor (ECF subfamily)